MDAVAYALARLIPGGISDSAWDTQPAPFKTFNDPLSQFTATMLPDGAVFVYLLNGSYGQSALYDPVSKTITLKANSTFSGDSVAANATVLTSGDPLVNGGNTGAMARVQVWNRTANTWSYKIPPIGASKYGQNPVVCHIGSDKVLLGGGYDTFASTANRNLWVYDYPSNTFTTTFTTGLISTQGFCDSQVINGVAYLTERDAPAYGAIYAYNIAGNTLTKKADNTARLHGNACAAFQSGGDVWVHGGGGGGGGAILSRYIVATNTWESRYVTSVDRMMHRAVTQADGTVLLLWGTSQVAGGNSGVWKLTLPTGDPNAKKALLAYLATK